MIPAAHLLPVALLARPPAKTWLSQCDVHDESYHLVTPQEARAAQHSAATQE